MLGGDGRDDDDDDDDDDDIMMMGMIKLVPTRKCSFRCERTARAGNVHEAAYWPGDEQQIAHRSAGVHQEEENASR
eukprot:2223459-Pleurochrysis_carterae.AAC.1